MRPFRLSRKYKVSFVLPSFAAGGAQRVCLTLMNHLDRGTFAPSLVVFLGHGPLANLVAEDTPVTDLGTPRLRAAAPRALGALRKINPDAIFSTFGHVNLANLAMAPLLTGQPRIVIREPNTPSHSIANLAHSRWLRLGYRLLYGRADAVVCPSQWIADELHRDFRLDRARIVALPNPVDEVALRRAAAAPQRHPGPGPRFVAAGQLIPQKGFDRLLDVIAQLSPDSHLTILGEGPEAEALHARTAGLGLGNRVAMPGFQPAPWPHIAGADAFLMPSRWEGMPNAALEALACGTPVIGTPEAGGLAEIAEDATPGAVTIAAFDAPFLAALSAAAAAPPATLRSSLLPEPFRLDLVMGAFQRVLIGEEAPA